MKVYRYNPKTNIEEPIFNIMKGTYTGKDMGERSITAQIDFPSRIDFQIGDYVKFDIATLLRANGVAGSHSEERFFIYTKPTVKKIARPQSHGKAFQHTVTFYPCQYELATVKMRDVLQEVASGVIYTGYDEFSFYGGANTLMKRIMAVLNERFGNTGVAGKDYWSYQIADSINEDLNTALEKFQFDFSDSSVMDALLKLNDAEGINTKFFINDRMIYVGYKRPYITGVDENNIQRSIPFEFMYGKTSHLPGNTNYGNLFTLTKAIGTSSPITRLYAYGSDRNLHRFYCSDRIKTGRYVNKLMLPSFEDDGRTEYIDSPEGIAKFGIREGSKTFDNIYPSLRFFYYGNLRDVKYCIKLMGSGLESDDDGVYENGTTISKANITPEQIERAKAEVDRTIHTELENKTKVIITIGGVDHQLSVAEADQLINKGSIKIGGSADGIYQYPIARIQCYRVVEQYKRDEHGEYEQDSQGNLIPTGQNELIESLPPVDLAVFCHATGKVVKCVLYANTQRQLDEDGRIPTRQDGSVIVGSCFAVHDGHPTLPDKHFECGHLHPTLIYPGLPDSNLREAWFTDADTIRTDKDGAYYRPYDEYKNAVSIHQIHYTDDHWITDVYEFTDYHQQTFNRQGYSAYCWPRVNKYYPESQSDNIEVNAVVDVGPVYIEDTDLNISQGQQQQTFDIYLRDVGFKINEQTWFGDKVFLFDTCKINFLDGKLAGYSFEMPAESDQAQLGDIYVPALKPDGSRNDEFFTMADNPQQAEEAFLRGAYWRIVAKRQETEVDRYYVPNVMLNASRGDHVVFLDIFMPDIYVRVAEQRLYKEAKKYLDANDDGDIQYSFDMDKVRPNEQPIFALQMREGAIMRIVDDDLDVGTINKETMLFEDKDGLVSMESMLRNESEVIINYEVVNRTREDIESSSIKGNHIVKDTTNDEWYLFFDTLLEDANKDLYYEDGITIFCEKSGISFKVDADNILGIEHIGTLDNIALHKLRMKNVDFLKRYEHTFSWNWFVTYSFKQQTIDVHTDQSVLPAGVRRYCAANNLTEFKPSKYYEVLIDTLEPDLAVSENGVPCFALVNGIGDGQTIFTPEYTAEIKSEEGSPVKSVLYKFTLSDEFDDSKDYYPAILYQSNGVAESVHVRLWSILERDDEHLGELNYVDLAIDTVTINFNDNTREAGVSLQDGQEPERLTTNQTEMVREITATVKEESRASAWAQLAQRMDAAEILQEQTLDFYQNLVNQSRQHYIQLLNLKNTIFDPDGTCKDTFLQVMMLQVGADSMNYQLKYTHYGLNGQTSNCDVNRGETEQTDPDSGKLYFDSFAIGNAEEVLDHFVYTDHPTNGEGGRWYPQERNVLFPLHKVVQEGQEEESYPTYFIALKASLSDPRDCHWVCEPIQHATNELVNGNTGYFYFNWGILAPDADGHYALTETRGNAYMYGDNLICGKISTLAGNSYFDLTHGDFVLSKDGKGEDGKYHEGLTYINGVLTIYGIPTEDEIDNIIMQLGIMNGKIGELQDPHTNLWPIDEEINLVLNDRETYLLGYILADHFNRGDKFTGSIEIKNYTPDEVYGDETGYTYISLRVKYIDGNGDEQTYWYDYGGGEYVVIEENGKYLFSIIISGIIEDIEGEEDVTVAQIKEIMVYIEPHLSESKTVSLTLYQGMIVSGNKSGVYSLAYKHITDAMKGDTQMVGGLTMTNLIFLKDEDGNVQAGMSGLKDYKIENGVIKNHGVTLFSGGDYEKARQQAQAAALGMLDQLSNLLPVLLTKTGVGSNIGCFRVLSDTAVEVVSKNGGRIEINAGNLQENPSIKFFDTNGVCLININGNTLPSIDVDSKSISSYNWQFPLDFYSGTVLTTISLTQSASYGVTYNGVNNVKIAGFSMGLYSASGVKATGYDIYFDLYIGENKIGTISEYDTTTVFSNGSMYINLYVESYNFYKFYSISQGTYNLTVRNLRARMINDNGNWQNAGWTRIDGIYFGNGNTNAGWSDGNILFSTQSEDSITLGKNGLLITSSGGGVTEFRNHETNNYVRFIGLPNSATDNGQLYKDTNGNLKVLV